MGFTDIPGFADQHEIRPVHLDIQLSLVSMDAMDINSSNELNFLICKKKVSSYSITSVSRDLLLLPTTELQCVLFKH